MSIDQWSTTAGNNASGVTGVNWAEGQAPSTVNDSARAMMADVAAWYGQAKQNLALTSVAGTNTITATGAAQIASLAANQIFTIIPAATNTGATTLNVTPSGGAALGAKNVFANGAACAGGELKLGVPSILLYDGTQYNILAYPVATQADQEAGTSGAVAVTPAKQQFHPSAAKAWCHNDAGTTISAGYNISSVTDTSTGDHTFTFTTAFSSANYCTIATAKSAFGGSAASTLIAMVSADSGSSSAVQIYVLRVLDGAKADPSFWEMACFGDQ
jgi:hypothetical protein